VIGPVRALRLEDGAEIGNLNWITSLPEGETGHFDQARLPEIVLKRESALTNRHYIDCQDQITIGEFSTLAGVRSTLWTHEIDIEGCRQKAQPVSIGAYCFIGSSVTLTAGSAVGDRIVVGAGSVVTRKLDRGPALYAGTPARYIKPLPESAGYFARTRGKVI
jgi:acetyltransferase-like isoleucine patch superfamily enzyme